jgi:hypothetical protein
MATRVATVTAFLLVTGPAIAGPEPQGEGDRLSTECASGRVSVAADDAPAERVLTDLESTSDLRIVRHVAVDSRISIDVTCQPLPDVIRRVLAGNYSYQLYEPAHGTADQGSGLPATLWIFSEGRAPGQVSFTSLEASILHGDFATKKSAIRELRRLETSEASEVLSLALADPDSRVRRNAMSALRRIGSDEALAALASSALNNSPWEREQATHALSIIDGAASREYLLMQFEDESPRLRAAVVSAVVDTPPEFSLPLLAAALEDINASVRLEAVDALEELGGEHAIAALRQAPTEGDPALRRAIEESLDLLQAD